MHLPHPDLRVGEWGQEGVWAATSRGGSWAPSYKAGLEQPPQVADPPSFQKLPGLR